jgi:hypothetical protein
MSIVVKVIDKTEFIKRVRLGFFSQGKNMLPIQPIN